MEANFLRSKKMPLVIEPKRKDRSLNSLIETALSNKDIFLSQLLRYGALLFRGFEVQTAEDFTDFVKRFSGKEFFNYAGGASPRSLISGKVYNSTDYPPELMLELHNELSYSKHYPQHLYFFCETAPEKGGETILGDSRQILRRIRPKIAGLFKHKNILYERNLSANADSPYSWQKAFETEDKQLVEEICRQTGADFEWKKNDYLIVRQICPAISKHPKTSEDVWFNQAHGFHPSALDKETLGSYKSAKIPPRLNSYFGDGTPICDLMLQHIRQVLRNESVPHRWKKGDILILDNILTAHGRMPFSGQRKIMLAMT